MKELRPGSAGASEIRMIFASTRAGKRSSWSREQGRAVAGVVSRATPLADVRYTEHLAAGEEDRR